MNVWWERHAKAAGWIVLLILLSVNAYVMRGLAHEAREANRHSEESNTILRDRNRLFDEQRQRDEMMIEQHRSLLTVCTGKP